MRVHLLWLVAPVVAASACAGSQPEVRRVVLTGRVIAVDRPTLRITLKHDAVPNYMDAMTMPFKVKDESLLVDREVGESVRATLEVGSEDVVLAAIERVGKAGGTPAAALAEIRGVFSERSYLLPGDEAPDITFVDQDGANRALSDWRGNAIVLTFVYTRCPFPNFCPLMDRRFKDLQALVKQRAPLRSRVHLLSASFDPAYDTPQRMKAHAEKIGTDPTLWTYVTAPIPQIDAFATRFGLTIDRDAEQPVLITHSLVTAVIDRSGRLVRIYQGGEWNPREIAEVLSAAVENTDQ